MRRTLLAVAAAAALTTPAACGSGPSVASLPSATAAPASATVGGPAAPGAGVPRLGGDPKNLTVEPRIQAGTGTPPASLLTEDVVVGSGPAAKASDKVDVRYAGTLYDGTPFDSSWTQGTDPASFSLAQVVPGFARGITGMRPGGRRVIVIPPALGYGSETNGPIPGGSTLVFVVDLVGVS